MSHKQIPPDGGWHPSDRELLLYVNGELRAKQSRKFQTHLRGCWACALRHDRMAGAITAFMRGRESALIECDFPEPADCKFEVKLSQLADKTRKAQRSSWVRLAEWLRAPGFAKLAATAAVVAIITFIGFRLSSVPSVSAREILNRAELAESSRLQAHVSPVLHERLRVTRRLPGRQAAESVAWESWHDAHNKRFSQKIDTSSAEDRQLSPESPPRKKETRKTGEVHSVVDELTTILESNHMDPRRPLSASGFSAWHSSLREPAEGIDEARLSDGRRALNILTSVAEPFSTDSIVKAALLVREQDWHPVELHLQVSLPDGLHDYEVSETQFEVVALHTLSPSIFETLLQPAVPPTLAATPVIPDAMIAESRIVSLELAVQQHLHSVKACLGEEIDFVRTPAGPLEVRGIVENSERRDEILRALAVLPEVKARFQTSAEADTAVTPSASYQNSLPEPGLPGDQPAGADSALYKYLLRHFVQKPGLLAEQKNQGEPIMLSAGLQALKFSNKMVSLSQAAYAEAWALRRLVERYTQPGGLNLTPDGWAILQTLIRDHVEQLSKIIQQCEGLAVPVLSPLLEGRQLSSHDANRETDWQTWPSGSMRLFETTIEADRLINSLIEESRSEERLPETVRSLLSTLVQIQREARTVATQVSQAKVEPIPARIAGKNSK